VRGMTFNCGWTKAGKQEKELGLILCRQIQNSESKRIPGLQSRYPRNPQFSFPAFLLS
jgi:hypothetical protein